MSEAIFTRAQTTTVQLGHSTAKITVKVEYTNPLGAKSFLERVGNFLKYCEEYPNAQLDLLKNALTSLPGGDSRTNPDAHPGKSSTKNAAAPKKATTKKAKSKNATKPGRQKAEPKKAKIPRGKKTRQPLARAASSGKK